MAKSSQATLPKPTPPNSLPLKRGGKPRKPRHLIGPRPTGPHDLDDLPVMLAPTEPDGEWEESAMPVLIGPVIDRYREAHAHRTPGTMYAFETVIYDFLRSTGLHENSVVERINRESCQRWKLILLGQAPHPIPLSRVGRRQRKAITVQCSLKNFGHFTRWLVGQDLLPKDPMLGLLLPARLASASSVSKEAFTDAELRLIIEDLKHAPFASAKPDITSNYYWLILSVMLTGARVGELLHIELKDVREIDAVAGGSSGVWCFDLKGREGRKLKTIQSTRKVPLHDQLITAGFLDYVATCKGPLLFPALEGPGVPAASRWFTDRLKRLGLKRDEVSCHSMRHSLTVKLALAKVDRSVRHRLLGHALGTSVEETTYLRSLDFSVKELKEAIDSARYPMIPKLASG